MNYKMQMHPQKFGEEALRYAHKGLAAGYIGLGLRGPDNVSMADLDPQEVSERNRNCLQFYHDMKIGDFALIEAHNDPVALALVTGDYEFVPEPADDVWCKHRRRADVWYWGVGSFGTENSAKVYLQSC
jgi:hypothetical protein